MGKFLKSAKLSKGGRPCDPVLGLGRVATSKLADAGCPVCWSSRSAFRVAGRILECWDFSENLNGLQDLVAFEY